MMVHRTPFFLPLLYPSSLVWKVPDAQKEVYLTFDDGPVPGPTEWVLDLLAKKNVRATFFSIGDNIRKHESVFRQILAGGHQVGNHTFSHLNGWKVSTGDYVENIAKCQAIINSAGDERTSMPLFRPPYGRITRKQIRHLNEFRIVMWDVLSIDFENRLSPEKCLRGTIRATRPGSVIVFHDSYKAEKNLTYALPRFIDHFLEQGFSFRVLT